MKISVYKIFMRNHSNFYLDYQNYYIGGIKQIGIPFKENASDADIFPLSFGTEHSNKVGQYIIVNDKKHIKCAIDTSDNRNIDSEYIYNWSDIYFKSNYWPILAYPIKVVPIINGNGRTRIELLKGLRQQEKIYDFSFISRVWGGREHNIRLFEKVSSINGNNRFLAIFNDFDRQQPETVNYQKRLEASGVQWTYTEMQKNDLWNIIAQSRYVMIRAGKHLCIPWRMIDLLCMGSSIVLDSDPYPQWPQPLMNRIHYISLGIIRPWNTDPAEDKCYDTIPNNLTNILRDNELQKSLSINSKCYFDKYAEPEKVIQYVLDCIDKLS